MDQSLTSYNSRLESWRLDTFKNDLSTLEHGGLDLKFNDLGEARPFYGLTIVAFTEPQSRLHERLCNYQDRIRTILDSADLGSSFSFLDPATFHMTICDIIASPEPLPEDEVELFLDKARKILPSLKASPAFSCELHGLGGDMTLTALAHFESGSELRKCLALENILKTGLEVDERSFLGHVSLAYMLADPRKDWKKINELLLPLHQEVMGSFHIKALSLCEFQNMNDYTPLITVDLDTELPAAFSTENAVEQKFGIQP